VGQEGTQTLRGKTKADRSPPLVEGNSAAVPVCVGRLTNAYDCVSDGGCCNHPSAVCTGVFDVMVGGCTAMSPNHRLLRLGPCTVLVTVTVSGSVIHGVDDASSDAPRVGHDVSNVCFISRISVVKRITQTMITKNRIVGASLAAILSVLETTVDNG
jgi:hypothetical protein